jgi:hypothetical protein
MKAGGRGSRQQMRGRGGIMRRETKIIETLKKFFYLIFLYLLFH